VTAFARKSAPCHDSPTDRFKAMPTRVAKVALAASWAFLTPIGHQNNTLILAFWPL